MKNHWAETILWFIAGLTNQFGNWSIETSYNDPKHSSQFKLVSVRFSTGISGFLCYTGFATS